MTRRDPNAESRQAGGYRNEDNAWDAPRQANQWQAESGRQSGGDWDADDDQRNRNSSAERAAFEDRRPRDRFEGKYGAHPRDQAYQGSPAQQERHFDAGYASSREHDRGYRFSGGQEPEYPSHRFDASAGNDYSSFTSEDFGGRDFNRGRSALSGGARPSNSYRPSWGPDSWGHRDSGRDTSGRDYGSWREYGEHRGFLERAGDEIASWFGDEGASRRREQDHRGRGPSDYTRSDERIREDVNDALTHDWRVDASHVRVVVKAGEVTLEGTVSSRQDKRRAEDLADDVTGVQHVQDNLRVQAGEGQSGLTAGTSTPGYSHTATSASASTTGSGSS
jgi:osmotically-inducible protein OsmY